MNQVREYSTEETEDLKLKSIKKKEKDYMRYFVHHFSNFLKCLEYIRFI